MNTIKMLGLFEYIYKIYSNRNSSVVDIKAILPRKRLNLRAVKGVQFMNMHGMLFGKHIGTLIDTTTNP